MSDAQIARYFNAGVLLFNFAAIEDLPGLGQDLMREAFEGRYLFRDQDILNKQFKEKLYVLDARWNVFNSHPESFGRVPQEGYATVMAARTDPWLIHYADRGYKPWHQRPVPHGDLYWQAILRTPFYQLRSSRGCLAGGSGSRRPAPGSWGRPGSCRRRAEPWPSACPSSKARCCGSTQPCAGGRGATRAGGWGAPSRRAQP